MNSVDISPYSDELQVLETLALAHAHLRSRAYGAVLLCALCLARGSTVAEVTGTLDMPGQDILEADILNVAQLVWSSPAAEHPKAALAAQVSKLSFICAVYTQYSAGAEIAKKSLKFCNVYVGVAEHRLGDGGSSAPPGTPAAALADLAGGL